RSTGRYGCRVHRADLRTGRGARRDARRRPAAPARGGRRPGAAGTRTGRAARTRTRRPTCRIHRADAYRSASAAPRARRGTAHRRGDHTRSDRADLDLGRRTGVGRRAGRRCRVGGGAGKPRPAPLRPSGCCCRSRHLTGADPALGARTTVVIWDLWLISSHKSKIIARRVGGACGANVARPATAMTVAAAVRIVVLGAVLCVLIPSVSPVTESDEPHISGPI